MDEEVSKCKIYKNRPNRCKEFPFIENIVDLTRDDLCPAVKEIVDQNEELLEELKITIFKYFIRHNIKKEEKN